MAITPVTLTGNVNDAAGGAIVDTRRTKVWLNFRDANGIIQKVVDPATGEERYGNTTPDAGINGAGEYAFTIWPTNAASNPTGFYYELHVDLALVYPHGGNSGRGGRLVWSSGPFQITASSTVAALDLDIPMVTATWRSEFMTEAESLLAQQQAVAGLTAEDSAVALLVETPTSATAAALSATIGMEIETPGTAGQIAVRDVIARPAESTQRLMAKMAAGIADASVLIVGDSTGNETTEWVYLWAQAIAADWPTHTVTYRLWDDGAGAYAAPVTIQTGTGARTLAIYNASISGSSTSSWQEGRATTAIYALNPDLIMLSMGHNEQVLSADLWHARYAALTESLTAALTASDLVCIAQNPATGNTYQQQRREVYREIAARRGYGFIDVCQAFLDTGDAPGLTADGIHPTAAGSQLWADTVAAAFVYDQNLSPRPLAPSSLLVPGVNLLLNAEFKNLTGGVPDNWLLTDCTAAVDAVNGESGAVNRTAGGSYTAHTSMKFTATAAGAAISQYVPYKLVRGGWVTVAARIYVPVGQSANVGRIGLTDSAGSSIANAETIQGRFRWAVMTRYIAPTVTGLRTLIYVDSSAGLGNCTIDRVVMVAGKFPHDIAPS